jgi:hypothetical protein
MKQNSRAGDAPAPALPAMNPVPSMELDQFRPGERAVSEQACRNFARLYAEDALRALGVVVDSAPLSDERILHLWDTHVAYETNPNRPKQPPLTDKDKLAFARAVLATHGVDLPDGVKRDA